MSSGGREHGGYWSGLPSPQELREYDAIKSGFAEIALNMIVRQQRHEHRARWAGIVTSSALAFGALGGACYFIAQGDTAGGAALSVSSTVGIITTYLSRILPDRAAAGPAEPGPAPAPAAGTTS